MNDPVSLSQRARRIWEHLASAALIGVAGGPVCAGLCGDALAHRVVEMAPHITSVCTILAAFIASLKTMGHRENLHAMGKS
jgi:hypothetical protein